MSRLLALSKSKDEPMTSRKLIFPALAAISFGLVACNSTPAVPVEYIETGLFKRNPIGVQSKVETLEIALDSNATQLSIADRGMLRGFFRAYIDHGHGPLTMILPEGGQNPQLSVQAVAEAREIAFETGVEYEEISGDARYSAAPALVLSFTAYDAIAPDCETFATVDFANVRSSNDLPNLGCSVRRNMAAMIADPADLLGTRPLDPGDTVRRQTTFDLYRSGEQTASERNEGESGTVSEAVDDQ